MKKNFLSRILALFSMFMILYDYQVIKKTNLNWQPNVPKDFVYTKFIFIFFFFCKNVFECDHISCYDYNDLDYCLFMCLYCSHILVNDIFHFLGFKVYQVFIILNCFSLNEKKKDNFTFDSVNCNTVNIILNYWFWLDNILYCLIWQVYNENILLSCIYFDAMQLI